ncbi:SDR family NAD(P)-dependent oxidoreductase [Mesorhizobium xinjiangense]|uniref:SDR family NAD(P)-dependent oxidoreductase n=1 Tax=Mesorhizobium xinjiangense TaxID=2678685 RepID=UPI0012EDC0CE|nr:SDR family oxidoreductase [Mesorhizobium xinjiangense]
MSRLAGKVALILGGSRGMGAAIAKRLAEEAADVAFTYASSPARANDVAQAIEAMGRRSLAIAADNRDVAAVEEAVTETVSAFGRLDILVNNAGIFLVGPVDTLTLTDFDETVNVNVRAAFAASRAALAHMGEGGRIVSIGSNLAVRMPDAGLSLYSMSKAALTGMTKALAREVGPKGITANIVHPGSTDTEMNPADGPGAEEQRALMAIPHFGEASEVAGLVAWLAGPDARGVTGAEFTIDGGANI